MMPKLSLSICDESTPDHGRGTFVKFCDDLFPSEAEVRSLSKRWLFCSLRRCELFQYIKQSF
jgi:hypothetical protein